MLNRWASLAMSTCVLKALPGKQMISKDTHLVFSIYPLTINSCVVNNTINKDDTLNGHVYNTTLFGSYGMCDYGSFRPAITSLYSFMSSHAYYIEDLT